MLKKVKSSHVILLVAAAAIAYALYNYAEEKKGSKDGLTPAQVTGYHPTPANLVNRQGPLSKSGGPEASCCASNGGKFQASNPLGQNSTYKKVNGVQTDTYGLPKGCVNKPVVDPRQLLPKDNNSQWGKLNPQGAGDLRNVNLLQAGYHIGINTVGQSLRNANLQLRSEPANPQRAVGPWNQSTIEPDLTRRPLEIGCGPK